MRIIIEKIKKIRKSDQKYYLKSKELIKNLISKFGNKSIGKHSTTSAIIQQLTMNNINGIKTMQYIQNLS